MNINLEQNQFIITFSYNPDLVSAVKSLPTRRYNPDNKSWVVPIAESEALSDLIDRLDDVTLSDDAKAVIEKTVKTQAEAIEASKATQIDIEVPAPEGKTYLPYQIAGINYGLNRNNVLIGDEMGLGKTIQAIGISNANSAQNILIICPASLRLNWLREWRAWDAHNRAAQVIETGKQLFPDCGVVICNYDLIKNFAEQIHARHWDMLILDEAHYCKNPKAKRTQLIFGGKGIEAIKADKKVILTGTPILNRPIEAWPILKSIAPDVFPNWKGYVTRYCAAVQDRYGWDVSGASNLGELQNKLRASVMVRRLKQDVLTELPAKRRQLIEIPANGCASLVKQEAAQWQAHQDKIEALRAEVELAKASGEDEYNAAVERLQEAASASFSEMSKIRHETALAKVSYVVEHLREAIESGNKVICFAHHCDVIAKIVDEFPGCVSITGETQMQARQNAVDKFQNDKNCMLFVGNIKAAGVGLTLTASSHVVFAELDWVPGNMSQAEDRAHRIGQTDSVLVQHIVLEDSLDATIAKRLIQKQEIIDKALDAEVVKEVNNDPIISHGSFATESSSRESIEKAALGITEYQAEKALEGIRIISSYCDGANALDGMGFSKIDVRMGKSLASFNLLTKKQAVIAMKLCRKYKRQLPEGFLNEP